MILNRPKRLESKAEQEKEEQENIKISNSPRKKTFKAFQRLCYCNPFKKNKKTYIPIPNGNSSKKT